MKIVSSFKTGSCLYDIAVDGGAVGFIPLGLILPSATLAASITIYFLAQVTSGTGNATIRVETLSGSPLSAMIPMSPTGVILGFDPNQAGLNLTVLGDEIGISIFVEPIITGKFIINVPYYEQ